MLGCGDRAAPIRVWPCPAPSRSSAITISRTLQEVVEEWLLIRVARGLELPSLGVVKINVRKAG